MVAILTSTLSRPLGAREQAVDRVQITDTLGWIYYKKKVYAQAISLLKRVPLLWHIPGCPLSLEMAYYKNGNKDLA